MRVKKTELRDFLRKVGKLNDVEIMTTDGGDWCAHLGTGEVKLGPSLQSASGYGQTPKTALNELARELSCQMIVWDARDREKRLQVVAPALQNSFDFGPAWRTK